MKEVQMTFRLEPDLRARFTEAAELEHRPAAQVLRELMRSYIEQARERVTGAVASDRISASERRQRLDAVRFARSSVGLEGFQLSVEAEAEASRFILGETELTDFLKAKAGFGSSHER